MRRASVFFLTPCGQALWTVEKGLVNLPGGKLEKGIDSDVAACAVREVKEELGGWPAFLSENLEQWRIYDVNCTRYFVIRVEDMACLQMFFRDVFANRHWKEIRKITSFFVEHVSVVLDLSAKRNVRHDLRRLGYCMVQDGSFFGRPYVNMGVIGAQGEDLRVDMVDLTMVMEERSAASTGIVCENAAPQIPEDTEGDDAKDAPTQEIAAAGAPTAEVVTEVEVSRRKCAFCRNDSDRMRNCWECGRWTCRKHSWWCTLCPKWRGSKYSMCQACYDADGDGWYLSRFGERNNKWICHHCVGS